MFPWNSGTQGPNGWERARGLMEMGFRIPGFDGMQTYGRLRFLYRSILRHAVAQSGNAVEIGCYKACSTVVMAKACLKKAIGRIYSLDLFSGTPDWNQPFDTHEAALERIEEYELGDCVTLIRADSRAHSWQLPIDVLHVDGDHSYDAVKADLEKFSPFLSSRGLLIADDYDQSHPEVKRAVDDFIGAHPQYRIVDRYEENGIAGSACVANASEIGTKRG